VGEPPPAPPCAELTQGEFEAEHTGFFPSLQATLNHIYVIDLFYVDALEGGWLRPAAWENPVPFPVFAELSEAQASMDKRLIGVCDAPTPALLSGQVWINRATRVQAERRDRLLMHLFSTKFTIVGKRTQCYRGPASSHRNTMNSSRWQKRR
jgi:uncharacterized damage-inducible protein DinB